MGKRETRFKLKEGERLNRNPNKPVIFVNQDFPRSYIWIGNDAYDDMACFATLTGNATLRRLGEALLKAAGPKRKRKAARR